MALIYPFIERNLDPVYNKALDRLALDRDLDVLDLATGTGILAGAFAQRGHQVTGVDFAENLLRRAERGEKQRPFSPHNPNSEHSALAITLLDGSWAAAEHSSPGSSPEAD